MSGVLKLSRPWVIILTPGNVANCTVGPECVGLMAGIKKPLGDKAYDSDSFRKSLRQDGITPVIPGRSNRKKRICYDEEAYKDRNVTHCHEPKRTTGLSAFDGR